MPTEITSEKLGEIAKLISKGMKRSVIRQRLGVSTTTLTKYFPAPPKRAEAPFEVEKWSKALDEGMSYKHVGEVFKVSPKTIRTRLPGRGWSHKQITEHAARVKEFNLIRTV